MADLQKSDVFTRERGGATLTKSDISEINSMIEKLEIPVLNDEAIEMAEARI